jgi:DNA-binding GntR family transcriptional regulator
VAQEGGEPVIVPRRLGALSRNAAHASSSQARRSKAEEAYVAIRNAILDGTLAPGAALDKPAICKELRLSRFPVTAAIARLAYEQLVDVEPQRGSFVSRIAARDARELMLVRRGIEVELAGEAALKLGPDAIAVLSRIVRYQQAAMEAQDFPDFHRLDHAFHDQLIESLGFARAGEILESIRTRVERVRRILLPVPGRISRTLEEHKAILAAIAARDEEAARHAMREHIARVLGEFEMLSRDRPDLFAP